MNIFIETIKVVDGEFCNMPLHKARMQRTMKYFYGDCSFAMPSGDTIPLDMRVGVVKCRIIYSSVILYIEYAKYSIRDIRRLMVVEDDEIEYRYKYEDRRCFERLLAKKGDADEILIVRNGYFTDSSFTNLVFVNDSGMYTPDTPLLEGVRRELLIAGKVVEERPIRLEDLEQYSSVCLINSMMELSDQVCVPVSDIIM